MTDRTITGSPGLTSPFCESNKVSTLVIPWWIKLVPPIIFLFFLYLVFRRFGFSVVFLQTMMLLLLLCVTDIFLHEKSHALFFYLITGKQAVINWKPPYPYFRAVIPCRLTEYIPVVLAPFLLTAFFGIITSILYLTINSNWVNTAFALSTVSSCLGTICDLYWFTMLRNLPRDFLIFDHGYFADIFATQELTKNQL